MCKFYTFKKSLICNMRKLLLILCMATVTTLRADDGRKTAPAIPAAELTAQYIGHLQNKKVALVVNPTSMIGKTHLVDSLLSLGIRVEKIFAPEHGFRGLADAGEKVENTTDKKTGLPVISLYGTHKKPNAQDLKGIDLVVFDIQDVGTRFFTYISTLHYVMEACAEQNIELVVLDRPNPNGHFVDGPIMEKEHQSFVGMHPIPVVHGMTMAEYALMINGEHWLKDSVQCRLFIIKNKFYNHRKAYVPKVKPSPNLPSIESIYLYPSTCFFEGTELSVGRGTYFPFCAVGSPVLRGKYPLVFKPESIPGMSKNPPMMGQDCYGLDLRKVDMQTLYESRQIHLGWLLELYKSYPDKEKFFNSYFEKLSGTSELRRQIIEGNTEDEIRATWAKGLENFRKTRKKYLLYKD
jgi:uncharacterized protein YbbC (DUF1343 family)